MSRLAMKPLVIPAGVKVNIKDGSVLVEGKLGKLNQDFIQDFVEIVSDGKLINVSRKGNTNMFKASQGLYYRLIRNMMQGVTEGYSKVLTIQGLGYKWEIRGKELVLTVGFSHPAIYKIPEGITLKLEKADTLIISGYDKQLVGQSAANIRFIKPPEPYKGKGIRYLNERVILKEGKSAK